VEDLDLKQMQSKENEIKLGNRLIDRPNFMFLNFLSYKLEWRGKKLIKVNRYFPSSKKCSSCGHINHELTLGDRIWTCPICGEKHDRDINAAINIKNKGLRLLTV